MSFTFGSRENENALPGHAPPEKAPEPSDPPREPGCLGSYSEEGFLGGSITYGLGACKSLCPALKGMLKGPAKHHERRVAPTPVGSLFWGKSVGRAPQTASRLIPNRLSGVDVTPSFLGQMAEQGWEHERATQQERAPGRTQSKGHQALGPSAANKARA